jgi:radical SAM enzyme (TIGR01210 family)
MMTNRPFASFIKELMPSDLRSGNPDMPVSVWKELDRIEGKKEDTVVAIFRTRGCSWYNYSSCSMCGYFNDIDLSITAENLYRQIDHVGQSLNGIKVLKIFTSGSFLDPIEIPPDVREYFMNTVGSKIDTLLVESRTEYIREDNIRDLGKYGPAIRIAIGLESTNDNIISNSINKGSTFAKYKTSALTARKLDYTVRTYLLFKPPFITEKDAIADMIHSISDIDGFTDDISVNPMNVQKNTFVEYLWKRHLYRPPRLWSLARILLDTRKPGRTVISYPTGGNKERGVHNSKPDRDLLDLIVSSSLSQDFSELESYYKTSNLRSYEEEIELEARLVSDMDIDVLSKRSVGYSIKV